MAAIPIIRRFALLTASFPHGAYQSQDVNQPELRAPSVKGQLRWWFDAIYGKGNGDRSEEDSLFGGLKAAQSGPRRGPQASRVIVRVRALVPPSTAKTEFIPHKYDDRGQYRGGQKTAILPGGRFEVSLLPKREGWSEDEAVKLERVLDAWLLLGAIGQRANRGAGSLWPDDAPSDLPTYMDRLRSLLAGTRLRAAVLQPAFDSEIQLRKIAGDFLSDRAFQSCMTPFGSARPRKPSLLRLRAARLGDRLHLVALWDGRFQASDTLARAVETLAVSKEIGRMLQPAVPTLCG